MTDEGLPIIFLLLHLSQSDVQHTLKLEIFQINQDTI